MALKSVSNRKRVVGERGVLSSGKAAGGGGGSKHSEAGEHLMHVSACNQDSSEIFESRVEDSFEIPEKEGSEVDCMAHCSPFSKEAYLAQERVVDLV